MSDLVIKVNSVDSNGAIIDYEVVSGTAESIGYDGYRSAKVKFVNAEGNEIEPDPITEVFEGTVQIDGAGSITGINITQAGIGYPLNTQAQLSGGLLAAAAEATVIDGQITEVNLTSFGSGYRTADTNFVFLYADRDEEIDLGAANIEPIFNNDDLIIVGFNVTSPGAGYPATTALKIINTRQDAQGTATVVGGKLDTVTLTVPGTGYHPDSTVIRFIDPSTGNTITPLVFPIVEPTIDSAGNLTALTITRKGSGLPAAVNLRIINQIPKVTATASLSLDTQGKITGVTLTNPGSGYRSATTQLSLIDLLTSLPINRGPAEYTPIIDGQGRITGSTQISSGNGYPDQVRVRITDNFSAASITPTIGLNGDVQGFTINEPGSGYLNPTIDLVKSGSSVQPNPFVLQAVATGRFVDGILTGIEILEPGAGYPDGTQVLIVDDTQESCPDGVQSQNMWANILGPDLYSLAIDALNPQDPLFTRQQPVYDYCGRLIGYEEILVTGDRAADGGNPLNGAVTDPLKLNHTFIWVDGTSEDPDRLGWGVEGYESEQLVGATGSKKLTKALDLGPTITLYRGQSHLFSLPSGNQQEFYIYEVREEAGALVPDIGKRFSQGLHRFETGEYLDDANGRNEESLTWVGEGNVGVEPEVWKRKDLFPNGTTLLFQIGEGDPNVAINHWPEYLAYSNETGTKFGLFKLV